MSFLFTLISKKIAKSTMIKLPVMLIINSTKKKDTKYLFFSISFNCVFFQHKNALQLHEAISRREIRRKKSKFNAIEIVL
jgi:hypothetical protein